MIPLEHLFRYISQLPEEELDDAGESVDVLEIDQILHMASFDPEPGAPVMLLRYFVDAAASPGACRGF